MIRGKTSDPGAVRPVVERWMRDLAPGATGWLGTTSGIADDNQFLVLVRFESEADARANSDRPEQGEWWAEMEALFDGSPTFRDSGDVFVETRGDLDSAGFVQVRMGTLTDPDRARKVMIDSLPARTADRPDILGTVNVLYGTDEAVALLYFESEEAARQGVRKESSPEVKAVLQEMQSLLVGQSEILNLRTPWLDSPV
jgi:heme-degrading monooxygenase HmoA